MDYNQEENYHQQNKAPKKSNKIKVLVVAVVLIVSIFVGLFYFFVLSNNDSERIIGAWEVSMDMMNMGFGNTSSSSSSGYWVFYSNGSAKAISISEGTDLSIEEIEDTHSFKVTDVGGVSVSWIKYEIKNDKLYLKQPEGYEADSDSTGAFGSSFTGEVGLDYTFKNDDEVEITFWIMTLKFKRIDESSISLEGVDRLEWGDMNITVDVGWSSDDIQVRWDWINLSRSDVSYSGDRCPSEWGDIMVDDVIEVGMYGDKTVRGELVLVSDPDKYMPWFSFY